MIVTRGRIRYTKMGSKAGHGKENKSRKMENLPVALKNSDSTDLIAEKIHPEFIFRPHSPYVEVWFVSVQLMVSGTSCGVIRTGQRSENQPEIRRKLCFLKHCFTIIRF